MREYFVTKRVLVGMPKYVLSKEESPEQVVQVIARSIDSSRHNGIPDAWVPTAIKPHAFRGHGHRSL